MVQKKLPIEARAVPLTEIENGTLRVTGTRIPLERIVECYQNGYTPEKIVESFDTLQLADVYLVIGYYLEHKGEVEEYLRERETRADEIRQKVEASQTPGFREELKARWARMKNDASPGDRLGCSRETRVVDPRSRNDD